MFAKLFRRPSILIGLSKQSRFYSSGCKMPKTALLILANGAEEMEAVITVDVLRRAGVDVKVAGLDSAQPVKCSRDVVLVPDASFTEEKDNNFDIVIMPGGLGGSKALCNSKIVGEVLKRQEANGCYIAAICAAPIALAQHEICVGKSLTSYPSMKPQLEGKYKYVDDKKVVHDDKLITSRGPATAFDFALKIAEVLAGSEISQKVAKEMLYEH